MTFYSYFFSSTFLMLDLGLILDLSLLLYGISFFFSFLFSLCLLLLPESFYSWIYILISLD